MSTRHAPPTFPPEVWSMVMEYCSANTLKALAQVSHCFSEESRRHIYHTIFFDDGGTVATSMPISATRIGDLSCFRSRHGTNVTKWRSTIREVSLCWSDRLDVSQVFPNEPVTPLAVARQYERQRLLNLKVRDVALLLSHSPRLEQFHLSLPGLYSCGDIPFVVPNITSLTIPMPHFAPRRHDWLNLSKIFQIPTLKYLELRSMVCLDQVIPDDFRRPGISNVTHLKLTDCGPVSRVITPLLEWPRDLQSLSISVKPYGSTWIVNKLPQNYVEDAMAALEPLKHSLLDFEYQMGGLQDYWIPLEGEETYLPQFTKLRRLRVPLEMVIPALESIERRQHHSILTVFQGLDDLVVDIDRGDSGDSFSDMKAREAATKPLTVILPDDDVRELFEDLSLLVKIKQEYLPEMRTSVLVEQGAAWLESEHAQQITRFLQEGGITTAYNENRNSSNRDWTNEY